MIDQASHEISNADFKECGYYLGLMIRRVKELIAYFHHAQETEQWWDKVIATITTIPHRHVEGKPIFVVPVNVSRDTSSSSQHHSYDAVGSTETTPMDS